MTVHAEETTNLVALSETTETSDMAAMPEITETNVTSSTDTIIEANNNDTTIARPNYTIASYEPPHGFDVNFIKSRTNPAAKPYTFWQDQTWVGIPLFFAGMIAKSEKTAFRQDYNNPNTKIRLIKYNFHSEIDNYTQYVPLALTIGLKMGSYESRSDWPRFWASAAMSSGLYTDFGALRRCSSAWM